MTELTEAEIAALAVEAELKRSVLTEHALGTDVMGQMRTNIERMEREGTTEEPALDFKHPENQGKTQYRIDKEIQAEYGGKRDELETAHPEFFEVAELGRE